MTANQDPIQAAREAAARAVEDACEGEPVGAREIADAAVVAFLRALPGEFPIPAILAAAVERAGEKSDG